MWKDLNAKDRWLMVTAGLQAIATIGTFLVAMVGIWQVTPIISYQVQQQQAAAERSTAGAASESITDRFAADAVGWWSAQVTNYQRVLDLTGPNAPRGRKLSFELIVDGTTAIAPGVTPDLLVVTSTSSAGTSEIVKVPVNEEAMPPAQYLQCRVNQGAFAALAAADRSKVEIAVLTFIQRQMVPRATPPHVRSDMSIDQVHDEIALVQGQRVAALQHLLGLKAMLDAVVRGP
ncbi:MAG: hypothetical protein OEY03_14905 [Rhizobacter sp.]|nr:hypothetical protein [Rhizobacter sp.]